MLKLGVIGTGAISHHFIEVSPYQWRIPAGRSLF